ncbi:MAG: bifunctional pyr operon transcriptional regulator/uracil phosphoribosyltransferase PyrR [Lachnospiraceae bacterium]|nr:bifunctional pyr operon transcriptional regulator/uracil phosphoribosyltransferase PyrR [Lachnospiraceae bacterium]
MKVKAMLMDEMTLKRSLMRISHEILEKNKGTDGLVILGIRRRGKALAGMIRDNIEKIEGVRVPCGELDINFYRDDLTRASEQPVLRNTLLEVPIAGQKVILVDDVLYTGRTVRAGIEAIFSVGRPKEIQLAILIDRGHRELPIRADYVGKSIPTAKTETVRVLVPEFDGETAALLCEREENNGTN